MEHHLMDWLHIVASVGLGVGAAIFGMVKWVGHRYSRSLEDLEASVTEIERDYAPRSAFESIESRVSLIEREYITRTSVEGVLARMDQRVSDGFSRIDQRLDDLYKILHR